MCLAQRQFDAGRVLRGDKKALTISPCKLLWRAAANRLIAAQLEKAWEKALRRVEARRQRLDAMSISDTGNVLPDPAGLADDLSAPCRVGAAGQRHPRLSLRQEER
jgi:hypothetical protein